VQKKVLVVEDHADARDMLELFLTSEGYSVISSEDGQVGLDVAKRERPAVIITNLNMPNLDGTEMIKQLRQEPGLDGATIIVLSAVRTENPQALINAGVSAVLSKPVELEELLRIINNALTGIACQNKS
jgi:DNA-binding response OmpR family regulator